MGSNEKVLLQQIAAGDERAFRAIFDLYKLKLYHFVLQFTHSPADAEEIVQEVFLKLWQNRERLQAVDLPANYIYTIARNLAYNYLNKLARNDKLLKQVWAGMQVKENPTEAMLEAKESQELIRQALAELSPQKQKVFNLSRQQGMSHEEIAAALGLSRSRVKNIIVEVLKQIKLYLEKYSIVLPLIFGLYYHQPF